MTGGARPGAGNPGYGKMKLIREKVEQMTPKYFAILNEFLDSNAKEDKRFAVTELTKLMSKMMPTELTGPGGEQLSIQLVNYANTTQVQPEAIPATTTQSNGPGEEKSGNSVE